MGYRKVGYLSLNDVYFCYSFFFPFGEQFTAGARRRYWELSFSVREDGSRMRCSRKPSPNCDGEVEWCVYEEKITRRKRLVPNSYAG